MGGIRYKSTADHRSGDIFITIFGNNDSGFTRGGIDSTDPKTRGIQRRGSIGSIIDIGNGSIRIESTVVVTEIPGEVTSEVTVVGHKHKDFVCIDVSGVVNN